eukprot:scaffold21742_cov126-Isochrysis_galbana.AAC.6
MRANPVPRQRTHAPCPRRSAALPPVYPTTRVGRTPPLLHWYCPPLRYSPGVGHWRSGPVGREPDMSADDRRSRGAASAAQISDIRGRRPQAACGGSTRCALR